MQYRPATPEDATRIFEIILQAKAQMRAAGSRQWQSGYPAPENIDNDIAHGWGYVLCREDQLIAYGAVIFEGERSYDDIDGRWLADMPYVVVHRLAVADEAKKQGVATQFMRRTAELAHSRGIGSFRVDTNFDNRYMLRMLSTLGFTHCGEISYNGDKRLAFELLL